MPKTFFITTAIDYTNSPPHIGHAYEKVLADVIARYRRLKGEKVFFLTGVDQHGQKVQQSAAKAGVAPSEFVKGVTQKFIDLWKKLDVDYQGWAETTAPLHKNVVQGILRRLWNEKDPNVGESKHIYKAKQSGYYSVRQEQFLTDKERGADGEFGPEWGQVEFREEENYYFKLEQHKQWLLDLIDKRAKTEKPLVIPDFRQTELRNAVEKLSGDLCISRPKSRLNWGIELPFDKDFVTYVWFDALTNYISFADYDPSVSSFNLQPSTFLDRWPALQIIGKDILVPAHGIYWLIMLRAIGFPDEAMPRLLVHGWWNLGGAKMSKSAGNVVDPFVLADKYGADAVRYYLMRDIARGGDADFDEKLLLERYHTELGNKIGNLVNRSLNMAINYRDATLRNSGESKLGQFSGYFRQVYEMCMNVAEIGGAQIFEEDEEGKPIGALGAVLRLAQEANAFVETQKPWKLAKDKRTEELGGVLYQLAEVARILAILISPVLQNAAHGIFDQLNWKMELSGKEERFALKDAEWGKLPDGHVVGKPVPLFPRIETS